MKQSLKLFLAWCIMEDDSEHGRAIVAHDDQEASKIVICALKNVKGITVTEAKETTKQMKTVLQEMYEKQNAFLGV